MPEQQMCTRGRRPGPPATRGQETRGDAVRHENVARSDAARGEEPNAQPAARGPGLELPGLGFAGGSQGMSGDPECCRGTYEGHTLLPAQGRKPSTLATPAEFPTAMLSHTRHLAPAK